MARALLRLALSQWAPVAPDQWRFEPGEHGRPELVGPKPVVPLTFSVSHSGDVVGCLVAMGVPVGLDTEIIRPLRREAAVVERCFSSHEAKQLGRLPQAARKLRFFEHWTLKEAYAKALGVGLGMGLRRVAFDLMDRSRIHAYFDPSLADDPSAWQFELLRSNQDLVVAVAARPGRSDRLGLHVHTGYPPPIGSS